MIRITRVRKRDGREVPFEKVKISDAVGRAQSAVGIADPHFAAEVADVVEMALVRRYTQGRDARGPEPVPGIEEIQDLVEQALIELGHASVAKAYILYRDRRARLRAALEVRSERDAPPAPRRSDDPNARRADKRAPPRVQIASGIAAWSKGRIVVALMNEADLPRATAEQVAARVEERVFDSGLKRISTALIRELVDNELVELGLAQALKRQRPLLVPRHDLRRLLAHADAHASASVLPSGVSAREPLAAGGVADRLSGALLSRYALEDVLPEAVAELHQAGELDFQDLSRCHLALTQAVPCELLLAHDRSASAAFEMLEELARLAAATSYGVALEDAHVLVQTLLRGTRAGAANAPRGSGTLASFLLALAALAQAAGRSIDLVFPPCAAARDGKAAPAGAATLAASPSAASERGAGRERGSAGARGANAALPSWLTRLIDELGELSAGAERARLPRLFIDGEDLELVAREVATLRPTLERLLARGLVVPTWSVAGERFAAPGLTRAWRERGALVCGGACALNLVRAARRAGPWREDALLENVARSLESALEGLAALHEFQRRERWIEASQRGLVRARVSYAITPVGLREALRLVADGELRPEQAARLCAFLSEAVQRFSKSRGLPVVLSAWFGERAALRFAGQDREQFHAQQALLFDVGESERAGDVAAYSTGFDLSSAGNGSISASVLEAAEAAVCATQKSGALHPPQILRALGEATAPMQGLGAGSPEAPSEPRSGASGVLGAWERLERARTRLRSGAWALYALPPSESASGALVDGPTLYSDDSVLLEPAPDAGASDFDSAPRAPERPAATADLAPAQAGHAPAAALPGHAAQDDSASTSAFSKTSHREES